MELLKHPAHPSQPSNKKDPCDLEAAILMFKGILNFELKHRLFIKRKKTGMILTELESNGVRLVLSRST